MVRRCPDGSDISIQFNSALRVPGLWCDEFLGTDCSFCRIQNHCQPHGSGTRTLRCSFEGCVDICWSHLAFVCMLCLYIHVMYLHVLFTHKGAYKCVWKCFAPTQYQYHTNIYKLLKSLLDESKRAWSFYFQGSSAIKSQGPCLNWRRHASWTSDDVHVFLPGGILWFLDNTYRINFESCLLFRASLTRSKLKYIEMIGCRHWGECAVAEQDVYHCQFVNHCLSMSIPWNGVKDPTDIMVSQCFA